MSSNQEIYISVDLETAGPIPGKYSLLSIGACLVEDDAQIFECILMPTTEDFDPKALEVSGLSLDLLRANGVPPSEAMSAFRDWIESKTGEGATPVFVGFNAPFDWSFINYYFHMYLGSNPFGFTALDIKALYMGSAKSSWTDTRSSKMAKKLNPSGRGTHDALSDAIYQAELFRLVIKNR
jgi:DNA polymerase III epsilon subunit-like protein